MVFIIRREKFASGQDIIFSISPFFQGVEVDNVVHVRHVRRHVQLGDRPLYLSSFVVFTNFHIA